MKKLISAFDSNLITVPKLAIAPGNRPKENEFNRFSNSKMSNVPENFAPLSSFRKNLKAHQVGLFIDSEIQLTKK